jgi:ABC-type antimicrobial peptide transport system permease subunit
MLDVHSINAERAKAVFTRRQLLIEQTSNSVAIPIKYSLRSLLTRRVSTLLITLGIALVVFIFISMIATAQSMKRAIVQTGSAQNVIIKNKAVPAVEFGLLPEDVLSVIRYLPGIARSLQNAPLVSPELYNRKFIKFGDRGKVIWLRIRGVTSAAFDVYPQVTVVQGRLPRRGEVMIGKEVAVKFGKEFAVGDTLQVGKETHLISGIFESGGSTFEGEIWMDKEDMKRDFDMHGLSQVTVRLETPTLKDTFIQDLNHNLQLPAADAIGEKEYFASEGQSSTFVLVMGIIIAVLMALGAIFGGMNLMYMTIAARIREIGTLRALGFSRSNILVSLIFESVVIALLGGIAGGILSIIVNGYSLELFEVAFSITVSPFMLLLGLLVSLFIGIGGGLMPGLSASRMQIVEALRHI